MNYFLLPEEGRWSLYAWSDEALTRVAPLPLEAARCPRAVSPNRVAAVSPAGRAVFCWSITGG